MDPFFISDESSVYSLKDLALIDWKLVPKHVAIMMDGNRRWAKARGLPPMAGHSKGAEGVHKIVRASTELGIKVLTLYAFSTENWKRSKEEVLALMQLFKIYLESYCETMVEEGVRFDTIGDLSPFPKELIDVVEKVKEKTKGGDQIDLIIALNYGARDEIRRAVQAMISDCEKGKFAKENLSEDIIASYLDTAKWGDPDLLIRTSGEHRLSNFLLWQMSYAEVYLTKVLWPDFSEKELLKAVQEYQRRDRRLGGI